MALKLCFDVVNLQVLSNDIVLLVVLFLLYTWQEVKENMEKKMQVILGYTFTVLFMFSLDPISS